LPPPAHAKGRALRGHDDDPRPKRQRHVPQVDVSPNLPLDIRSLHPRARVVAGAVSPEDLRTGALNVMTLGFAFDMWGLGRKPFAWIELRASPERTRSPSS